MYLNDHSVAQKRVRETMTKAKLIISVPRDDWVEYDPNAVLHIQAMADHFLEKLNISLDWKCVSHFHLVPQKVMVLELNQR